MATFSATYDANMIREDLADVITIMTPTDLPLTNLLDSQSVHDVYFDWGIDELATPTSTSSKKENESITYLSTTDAPEPPRITAGVCIERNAVQIADTRRVVLEAGMDDAYNYMLWKQSVKTMKQLEFNMHWGNEAAKITTAVARMCIGVVTWCAETSFAETLDGVDFNVAPHSSYQSNFFDCAGTITRAQLNDDILLPGYRNGMNIDGSVLLCGARVKRAISEFLMVYSSGGTARRNIGQESKAHVDTIDYFASDFGEIAVNLDRYFDAEATTIAYDVTGGPVAVDIDEVLVVVETDHFHRAILRGLGHVPLAKDGDSTKGMCVAEIGIKCDNPLSITGAYNAV